MRYALALILALSVSACDAPDEPSYATNQQKRQELFQACLKALPAGPQTTHYNDWDEVVDSCESAAYYQSKYCYKNCPPEEKAKP